MYKCAAMKWILFWKSFFLTVSLKEINLLPSITAATLCFSLLLTSPFVLLSCQQRRGPLQFESSAKVSAISLQSKSVFWFCYSLSGTAASSPLGTFLKTWEVEGRGISPRIKQPDNKFTLPMSHQSLGSRVEVWKLVSYKMKGARNPPLR